MILAGIRFYNREIDKPFIDIVAWSGALDWDDFKRSINLEFSMFNPKKIRILHNNDIRFCENLSSRELGQTVHIGKLCDVVNRQLSKNIALVRSIDPAKTWRFVNECYQVLCDQGYNRHKSSPVNFDELLYCATKGTLHEVYLDNKIIGVFATRWGNIDFIEGHVVVEEVIHPMFHGMGIAKQIQAAVARVILRSSTSKDNMIGTIHAQNIASKKTATSVGRKSVLFYEFFDIG